jgi:pilus assembly protein FimV
MEYRMRGTLKPWVVALGLALAAEIAPAAGFGRINVNSALGQPLAAEIDLLNVSPEDLVGMQVRLASPESFREANVELSPALSGVRFTIEKRPNGQAYIRISSNQPISEPAINLLVEVIWPSGRLLRDYPVLLNPAGYGQDRIAVDAAPRTPPSPPEIPLKAIAPAPVSAAAQPAAPAAAAPAAAMHDSGSRPAPTTTAASASAGAAPAPAAGAADGYLVKPGDTVRVLAAANRPASASLEQTMLAMFEANRAAFINDSIHRIRAGKRVHLPTADEAAAVSADEANRRVTLLSSDFDAYRKRLADAASARPGAAAPEKGPVTGKLTASTEDAGRPSKPGGDVLQVSRSAAGKTANGGQAQRKVAADDRAAQLEEEAIARENQLREARERVAQLEANLQQMRKLLSEKNAPVAKSDVVAKTAPAPTPPALITPPVTAPEVLKPLAPPVVAEAPKPAIEAPKPAVEAPKPAEPVKAEAKPAVKPPVETSFMDDVLAQLSDNPLALGGGILSGLLVGWLGLNSLRRRRDRTQELFAPSTTAPEPMTVDAVTSDKASAMVDTSNPAYASEFERTVPEHPVDEVDPVAEADVYIAYGRDVQAEEILKEAMVKDPDRTEILMKLLEIYAQRKSGEEYAQHALQLRERVGTAHPLWSAAMAMGYEIDPENPLYQGAGEDFVPVALTPPPAPDSLDLDLSEHGLVGELPIVPGEPIDHLDPDLTLLEPVMERADAHAAGEPLFQTGEPESHPVQGLLEIGEPGHAAGAPVAESGAGQPADTGTVAAPEHIAEDEAAETLRALSAISADSLRSNESAPRKEAAALAWPALPEVAALAGKGATGALAASSHGERVAAADADPFTLDFELGDGAHAVSSRPAAMELGSINLDIAAEPMPTSPPVLTLVPALPHPGLQPAPGESGQPARNFGELSLEVGGAGHAPLASADAERSNQWHNVATKLDLARAYLEIGDREGAREILREVSAEGDDGQREEAERLAVQI